jgi:hypothetical protein
MSTHSLPTWAERVRAQPHLVIPGVMAWLRGLWLKLWLPLTGRRFRAGRRFRVYGPLTISGPGRVEFGDDVLIIGNAIRGVCIRTLAPAATLRLGNAAGLNGTSIQCIDRVEIGDLSNLADAFISDTAAHVLGRARRRLPAEAAKQAPVVIGRNVWISVQCVILHGVHIGDDSVIGACSLVRESVPAGVFAAGNPLRVIRPLPDD